MNSNMRHLKVDVNMTKENLIMMDMQDINYYVEKLIAEKFFEFIKDNNLYNIESETMFSSLTTKYKSELFVVSKLYFKLLKKIEAHIEIWGSDDNKRLGDVIIDALTAKKEVI